MRALLLDGKPKLVDDYPAPEPPPGEALIRVNVAGVCNTDLELVKGYHQEEVQLISGVQRLLYRASEIDVEAHVWLTWTKGIY